jgi:type II secretory pathway pseudopilin PulG
MPRRHGLSLLEMLLVIGIVVLLMGILLPALTRQREEHRPRSECANHLKQIALAVHNYNDVHQGKLPPLADFGENAPTGGGLQSLFFNLLPYIEQDNVYRQFDRSQPATYYQPRTGAAQWSIRTFLCPQDHTAVTGTVTNLNVAVPRTPQPFTTYFAGTYATTSYAANGLIPWNTGGLPRSFKDGTSNTVMFAERTQVCTAASGQSTYNLWGFGFYGPEIAAFALLTPDTQAGLPSTDQIAPARPLPAQWTSDPLPVLIGTVSSSPQPSPVRRPFQTAVARGAQCDPRIPGTPHAGGMLVALGDGSVRSVEAKISEWTFWAACTPDGNESLYTDW